MTDPLAFPSSTPRHELPLLFSGQAQKEFTVNAAHALIDALLHPAIEGSASAPPAEPVEGMTWLVAPGATGAFADHEGNLACLQAGTWIFVQPRDGLRVYDRATGQHILYANGWRRPGATAAPQGGTTIDAEARSAIAALTLALQEAAILPLN